MLENGRAPSRESAQSVREHVVAVVSQNKKYYMNHVRYVPQAAAHMKKQNAKKDMSIVVATMDPVP